MPDPKKRIHTIQSSDKVEFDKQVNQLLELGCEERLWTKATTLKPSRVLRKSLI